MFVLNRFEIAVNWAGDMTAEDVLQLLEAEKRAHPNRSAVSDLQAGG